MRKSTIGRIERKRPCCRCRQKPSARDNLSNPRPAWTSGNLRNCHGAPSARRGRGTAATAPQSAQLPAARLWETGGTSHRAVAATPPSQKSLATRRRRHRQRVVGPTRRARAARSERWSPVRRRAFATHRQSPPEIFSARLRATRFQPPARPTASSSRWRCGLATSANSVSGR